MNLVPFNLDFPIGALPETMAKAVSDAQLLTQAPLPLIASACFGAASQATQNLVDVERREGLYGPIGLFFTTICASGERKTTVDTLFTRAIREFDRKNDLAYESKCRDHAAELAVWQIKKKCAVQELQKGIKKGEEIEALSQALAEVVKREPAPPIHSPLLLSDATPAAIKKALRREMSSIGIFADEGSTVFEGQILSEFSFINELWDGGTIHVDRARTGRWSIKDARLTMSLMVQPEVFERFLERRGQAARDIGLLARMLIAYPVSTQGSRTLRDIPERENLNCFNNRVKVLLEEAQKCRFLQAGLRPRLKFDRSAQRRWNNEFDHTEMASAPCRKLAGIKDYAAKFADNLARLAAVFHVFEGCSGDISLDTFDRAFAVAAWYGECFNHLFSPPKPTIQPSLSPQIDQDTELLLRWLVKQLINKGVINFQKDQLLRCAPPRIRPAHRLYPALNRLTEMQVICPQSIQFPNQVSLHGKFIEHINQHKTAAGYPSEYII